MTSFRKRSLSVRVTASKCVVSPGLEADHRTQLELEIGVVLGRRPDHLAAAWGSRTGTRGSRRAPRDLYREALASSAFKLQAYDNGCYFSGTLFDRADRYMTIYWEETFGPVLSVLRLRAMTRIVAHELGNGAAMFTRDASADKIEAGMVGTNVADPSPGGLSSLLRLEAVDFRRSLHYSPA
jgi:hypothetical protein